MQFDTWYVIRFCQTDDYQLSVVDLEGKVNICCCEFEGQIQFALSYCNNIDESLQNTNSLKRD